jgi:hypothetical protein
MVMKLLSRLLIIFLFVAILGIVIAYARGYRFDFQNKGFSSTGIIAITSVPKTSKIYLNDHLKGVTDANLTLAPGKYKIEIKKEGFTSWLKNVNLKGELVVNLDVLLYPINPSLSPLTNLGVIKAVPLQDDNKVVVFTEEGIYLFETARRPLSFFPPLKTLVKKELFPEDLDFSKVEVLISPDQKQAIVDNYLISLEEENQSILDLSLSKESKQTLISAWEEQKRENFLKILETYPADLAKIASDSFKVISFSPTETKVLYQSKTDISLPPMITPPLIVTNQTPENRSLKKGGYYIYDKKEDKNYEISNTSSIFWYFDSRHLVVEEDRKISIVDYDNSNRQAVYSGPFEANFFTTTSDGKIIVLANLNPEGNKLPDLYLVGIR